MLRRTSLALCLIAGMASAQGSPPTFWANEWPDTDFTNTSIADWSEIRSGGPPKDGIPALTDPAMIPVGGADLDPREPVIALGAQAFPVRYLMWHEIANATVGGTPVAVTFCPLCNTGIVFDRRVEGRVLEFGVSGQLRNSDMVMYDRQTESWWQQATGEGIVGDLTGTRLTMLPALMQGWATFAEAHPEGQVMAEPDARRQYGANPYRGYDTAFRPFLYDGEAPPHGIDPLARVVRVGERAWPLERLRQAGRIEEAGLVLEWSEGQASALDTPEIAEGREVGDVRVTRGGAPAVFDIPFAFAFHAFHPDGEWMVDG